METNKTKGGRPRDAFADPYIVEGKDKDGKPIKICLFCGHQFSIKTSITRIKAHLGKVEKQDVILCTKVPFDVEEAARNSMPSLSSKRSNANITSNSDVQQPLPQGCYTSSPAPPQAMQSAQEQCPELIDGSVQQSNVDVQSNPLLQDDTQQPPSHGWHASASHPLHNMLLDGSMQQTTVDSTCLDMQLDLLGMGTDVLGHESLTERQEFIEWVSNMCEDPQLINMNEIALNIPQLNESCPTHSAFVSQHPMHHQRELSNSSPYQDASGRDSIHDTTISQDVLQGGRGVCPDSLPHSTLQEDMSTVVLDDHEDPKSQHHMQENRQLHHLHKRKCPDGSKPIGKKLSLESKFRGLTFNKMVDEIVKYLEDDSVSRIGVYGMGGSGKTTIMKYIHNRLLEEYTVPFTHVIWIDVYQDHTISRLQQHLASQLNFELPHNGGQTEWAATLNEKMEKMCYAVILDDVWDDINLEEVGIPKPSQENKCKLILTTRNLEVCNKMDCNRAIFLNLLSEEEARELFVRTLGNTPKDLNIQSIMKEVIEECARLPLAIVVVARGMKGKSFAYEWRDALNSLRDDTYDTIDDKKRVIRKLKFSFENLSEPLQQCLLYCALYPNDILNSYEWEVIKMLMMEPTMGSKKTLKSTCDHIRAMLKKLENACLLTCDCYYGFAMHDLIRDMCLDIVGGSFLVKCHSEFAPNESEFTEVVEKVSLMGSEFKDISLNMTPYCTRLSTLLLGYSSLTRISESFFMSFPGLQVLDLSFTWIEELPDSVTNLVILYALVLRSCFHLKYLPCLTPLKALKKLDLSGCSRIDEAPKGLEDLVNLTYLDLDGTYIKTFPSLSLRSLVKLQYLKLPGGTDITMRDVKELKNLEVLKAHLAKQEEFNEFVASSMLDNRRKLFQYDVGAGFRCQASCCSDPSAVRIRCDVEPQYQSPRDKFSWDEGERREEAFLYLHKVHNPRREDWLCCEVIGLVPSPKNAQKLTISGWMCRLKEGQTEENGELKRLFDVTFFHALPNLISLEVHDFRFVEDLTSISSSVGSNFPLRRLMIYGFDKLVRLVDPEILPCFRNLQFIEITDCKSIESIIFSPNPMGKEESNNLIKFPNLRCLRLVRLLNLRSICDGMLICPSIEYILVGGCPELKRLPLQLPVLDINSGRLTPPLSNLVEIRGESEWWESLEWDQPHAKALLQPYFGSYW